MARTITTVESPLTTFPSITKPPSADTAPAQLQTVLDALVVLPGQLNTQATTTNAAAADLRALADDVSADADAAAASAGAAAAQVPLATAQAALALQYAQQAQVEAPGAWNSGASYTFPAVAVGSDGNTYRCMGTGVVGVDPTSGTASWLKLTGSTSSASIISAFENCGGF